MKRRALKRWRASRLRKVRRYVKRLCGAHDYAATTVRIEAYKLRRHEREAAFKAGLEAFLGRYVSIPATFRIL